MTANQAKAIEWGIIALCLGSLIAIFQPWSLSVFSVGCVTVIIGGLAFNLIPFCRAGVQPRTLFKVVGIVVVILGIAALLGMGTALLYVQYIASLS